MNPSHVVPHLLGVKVIGKLNALISTYLTFYVTNRIVALFSQTFLIVYLLTLADIRLLGLLLAIAAIFEGFIDFPTGGLSKWIGHEWVYAIGMLFLGSAFFLLSIVQSPSMLVVVLILRAIGKSQQSGVIQSYFDESYSLIGQQDSDRSIYNKVVSRTTLYQDLFGYISAFVGAYLAVQLRGGRTQVFEYQAFGFVALAILGILFMRNYGKESLSYLQNQSEVKAKDRIMPLLFSPEVLIMTLGVVAFYVVKEVWFSFIMWPIYFGYTGDDFLLSIVNLTIFLTTTVVLVLFIRNRGGDRVVKVLPLLTLIHGLVAFLPVILITNIYPLNDTFQQVPVIILVSAGVLSLILSITIFGAIYRVLLDLIPINNQSSYHSLLPSITLIMLAPLYYFSGEVIKSFGYTYVLVVLILSIIGSAGMFYLAINMFKVGQSDTKREIETQLPFISTSSISSITSSLYKYSSPVRMSDTAATIWLALVKIAKADDKISENEMRLLVQSMQEIYVYSEQLQIALADNILTKEERQQLITAKDRIIHQLYEVAKESDNTIDPDEQAILNYVEEIFQYIDRSIDTQSKP